MMMDQGTDMSITESSSTVEKSPIVDERWQKQLEDLRQVYNSRKGFRNRRLTAAHPLLRSHAF